MLGTHLLEARGAPEPACDSRESDPTRIARTPAAKPCLTRTCHVGRTWGTQAWVNLERVRRWNLSLLLLLSQVTSVLLVTLAAAQGDVPVVLDYQSPAGCGTREQVLTRLQHLRGAALQTAGRVEATVLVQRSQNGFSVTFRAVKDSARSHRELAVADCAAAVEASALLLHFTLDPELAALAGSSVAPEAESAQPVPAKAASSDEPLTNAEQQSAPAASEKQPDALPTPEQAASRQVSVEGIAPTLNTRSDTPRNDATSSAELASSSLWVGLGSSLVSGITPTWAFGPALEGGLALGGWSLQLQASFHPVPSVPLDNVPGASLDSSLVRAHVFGGPVWGSLAFQGGPVVGLGVEHLTANPRGISNPESGASTWWSVVVGANIQARLVGPLGLDLRGGALASLERPRFTVVGLPGLVHQPSRLGWWGSLSVVWMWNTSTQ